MSVEYFDDYEEFQEYWNELEHTGVAHDENPPGRGSGRWGWGTGKKAYQHYKDWLTRVNRELQENVDYVDENGKRYTGATAVAKRMGMNTTEFRTAKEIATEETRAVARDAALEFRFNNGKDDSEGIRMSLDQVVKKMREAGFEYNNDSSIRALLNDAVHDRKSQSKMLADQIKELVDKNGMYDVGADAAMSLNVSKTKLDQALYRLYIKGYEIYGRGYSQVTNPGKQTNTKVICPPGTPYKDIYNKEINFFKNENVMVSADGKLKKAFEYPASFDSKRLMIRYGDQGGKEMDGVVEIRRGVDDCSLKNDAGTDSNYAQVRVLVDGTHYIKGMAVYSDAKGWPDGVDMVFNTNKPSGTPMMGTKDNSVLKPIKKDDPENPFGTLIKEHERGGQSYWTDADGNKHLRVINKKSDEGDWDEWAKKLPAQFLSKQPIKLIKDQLAVSIADKQAEFDEIKQLTNPTVRRQLLASFASDCDTTATKLKASPFPGQRYQVILPLRTISDDQVYAPNFKNGSTIWTVRFPHEGTFQIARLTVNNNLPEGKKVITANAKDAIGISANVAEKMSGADFDGDTVLCIPYNGKVKIKDDPMLKDLVGFDPKVQYGPGSTDKAYKHLSKGRTQNEMGQISNLIADMTVGGAGPDQLARAVKYSMTVIDADKHNLDYMRCYKEQGIKQLKDEWQGRIKENGKWSTAAATLITRANSEQTVLKRQGSPRINQKGKPWYDPNRPEGSLIYKTADKLEYEEIRKVKDPETKKTLIDPETGKPVWEKTGKTKVRTEKSRQMREVDDARELISPLNSEKERIYANYANTLKAMANEARKEQVYTGTLKRSPSAAKTYAKEVKSLEDQLSIAEHNRPLEKQAQYIAGCRMRVLKAQYPDLEPKEIKKKSDQYLKDARLQVGAKRHPISISEREWEAIQSGAISDDKLTKILKYADADRVRELATPRDQRGLSDAKKRQIKALASIGTMTNAQIAEQFGVSSSTISRIIKT